MEKDLSGKRERKQRGAQRTIERERARQQKMLEYELEQAAPQKRLATNNAWFADTTTRKRLNNALRERGPRFCVSVYRYRQGKIVAVKKIDFEQLEASRAQGWVLASQHDPEFLRDLRKFRANNANAAKKRLGVTEVRGAKSKRDYISQSLDNLRENIDTGAAIIHLRYQLAELHKAGRDGRRAARVMEHHVRRLDSHLSECVTPREARIMSEWRAGSQFVEPGKLTALFEISDEASRVPLDAPMDPNERVESPICRQVFQIETRGEFVEALADEMASYADDEFDDSEVTTWHGVRGVTAQAGPSADRDEHTCLTEPDSPCWACVDEALAEFEEVQNASVYADDDDVQLRELAFVLSQDGANDDDDNPPQRSFEDFLEELRERAEEHHGLPNVFGEGREWLSKLVEPIFHQMHDFFKARATKFAEKALIIISGIVDLLVALISVYYYGEGKVSGEMLALILAKTGLNLARGGMDWAKGEGKEKEIAKESIVRMTFDWFKNVFSNSNEEIVMDAEREKRVSSIARMFKNVKDIMANLSDFVTTIFRSAYEFFTGVPYMGAAEAARFGRLISTVKKMNSQMIDSDKVEQEIRHSGLMRREIFDLNNEYRRALDGLVRVDMRTEGTLYHFCDGIYKNWYNSVFQYSQAISVNVVRDKPKWIVFGGAPRVGKSYLGATIRSPLDMTDIFSQAPGSQYYDGYASQSVWWIDELFPSTNDTREQQAVDILGLISDTPVKLNMADVAHKANTFMTSKIVVSATNDLRWTSLKLTNLHALVERVTVFIEPVPKAEFLLEPYDINKPCRWKAHSVKENIRKYTADEMYDFYLMEYAGEEHGWRRRADGKKITMRELTQMVHDAVYLVDKDPISSEEFARFSGFNAKPIEGEGLFDKVWATVLPKGSKAPSIGDPSEMEMTEVLDMSGGEGMTEDEASHLMRAVEIETSARQRIGELARKNQLTADEKKEKENLERLTAEPTKQRVEAAIDSIAGKIAGIRNHGLRFLTRVLPFTDAHKRQEVLDKTLEAVNGVAKQNRKWILPTALGMGATVMASVLGFILYKRRKAKRTVTIDLSDPARARAEFEKALGENHYDNIPVPKLNVVKLTRANAEGNQAVADMYKAFAKRIFAIGVVTEDGNDYSQYATAVTQGTLLTPAHLFTRGARIVRIGTPPGAPNPWSVVLKADELTVSLIEDKDLCFVTIRRPKTSLPGVPDHTPLLMPEDMDPSNADAFYYVRLIDGVPTWSRVEREKTRFYKSEKQSWSAFEKTHTTTGAIIYEDATSRAGDCGLPLIAMVGSNAYLIGVHAASNATMCFAVEFTVSDMDLLRQARGEGRAKVPTVRPADVPTLEVVAEVPLGYRTTVPRESKLQPSPVQRFVTVGSKRPAALREGWYVDENGEKVWLDPLKKALQKHKQVGDPDLIIPADFLEQYANLVSKNHSCLKWTKIDGRDLELLRNNSIGKELLGKHTCHHPEKPGYIFPNWSYLFARNYDLSTSPGFPFTKEGYKTRGDCFEPNGLPKDRILAEVLDYVSGKHEVKYSAVFAASLKDELRPDDRVDQGNTRVFYAGSIAFNLVEKCVCGPIMDADARYAGDIETHAAVGVQPHGPAWQKIYNKHAPFPYHCTADCSGMDKTTNNKVIVPAMATLVQLEIELAGFKLGKRQLELIAEVLSDSSFFLVVIGDRIYRVVHGFASGSGVTTNINCRKLSTCVELTIYKMNGNTIPDDINDHVRLTVYGDDLILSSREPFDLSVLSKVARDYYGLVLTSGDKKGEPTWTQDWETVDFLKRKLYRGGLSTIYAPLSLETCINSIRWVRTATRVNQNVLDTLRSFANEMMHYPSTLGVPVCYYLDHIAFKITGVRLNVFVNRMRNQAWEWTLIESNRCPAPREYGEALETCERRKLIDLDSPVVKSFLANVATHNYPGFICAQDKCQCGFHKIGLYTGILCPPAITETAVGYRAGSESPTPSPTANVGESLCSGVSAIRLEELARLSPINLVTIPRGVSAAKRSGGVGYNRMPRLLSHQTIAETKNASNDTNTARTGVFTNTIIPESEQGVLISHMTAANDFSTGTDGTPYTPEPNPFDDINITDMLEAEYLVGTYTWTTAMVHGADIGNLTFPLALMNVKNVSKLAYYRWMRADVEVRVEMTGNPGIAGSVLVWNLPGDTDHTTLHWNDMGWYFLNPAVMSANTDSSLTVTIPYVNPANWFTVSLTSTAIGRLGIKVLNPLIKTTADASDAVIRVFARFKNIELAGPCTVTAQGKKKTRRAGRYVPTNVSADEQREKSEKGVLSGIARTVGGIAPALSVIPEVGAIAGPVGMVANALAPILESLGLSKPINLMAQEPAVIGVGQGWAGGAGLDNSTRAAMDPDQSLATGVVPQPEYDVRKLAQRPSFVALASIAGTSSTGTSLVQVTDLSHIGGGASRHRDPWDIWARGLYSMWRGGFKYKFQFFAPPYVSFRVALVYSVKDDTVTYPDCLGRNLVKIVDIRGDTEIDFAVPFLDQIQFVEAQLTDPQHHIDVFLLTQPTSQNALTSSSCCQIAVWRGFGEDVQFAVPNIHMSPGFWDEAEAKGEGAILEEFKKPFPPFSQRSGGRMEVGFTADEQIYDLRCFLHRPMLWKTRTTGLTAAIAPWASPDVALLPYAGHEMIRRVFLWHRGSIRIKATDMPLTYHGLGCGAFLPTNNASGEGCFLEYEMPHNQHYPWVLPRSGQIYSATDTFSYVYPEIPLTKYTTMQLFRCFGEDYEMGVVTAPPTRNSYYSASANAVGKPSGDYPVTPRAAETTAVRQAEQPLVAEEIMKDKDFVKTLILQRLSAEKHSTKTPTAEDKTNAPDLSQARNWAFTNKH